MLSEPLVTQCARGWSDDIGHQSLCSVVLALFYYQDVMDRLRMKTKYICKYDYMYVCVCWNVNNVLLMDKLYQITSVTSDSFKNELPVVVLHHFSIIIDSGTIETIELILVLAAGHS